MSLEFGNEPARQRLMFLLDTVALDAAHLKGTDERLFALPFTADRATELQSDVLLAERLDPFAARFARLQDTLGDKLLPALLARLGEPIGSTLDNLDRAHRLGLLDVAAEQWLAARALRNRLVHEYIRQPALLADAVNAAHRAIPMLVRFATACQSYSDKRRLTSPSVGTGQPDVPT